MSDEELKNRIAAAIKEDRCFTTGRLREEFRMKPAPGVQPVKIYKSQYGSQYGVYRIADCVPMRSKRAATEKQIEASKALTRRSRLNSKRGRCSLRAANWLDALPVFLDTETTGLGENEEVIEIGLTDSTGNVLMDVRLKPTVPVGEEAVAVHGISIESLTDAPAWPDIAGELQCQLTGKLVIIFNKIFDMRLLRQTAYAHGNDAAWLEQLDVKCAMYLAAEFFGATNRWGTISLATSVRESGVEWVGKAHSATGDAATAAAVMNAIAAYSRRLLAQ